MNVRENVSLLLCILNAQMSKTAASYDSYPFSRIEFAVLNPMEGSDTCAEEWSRRVDIDCRHVNFACGLCVSRYHVRPSGNTIAALASTTAYSWKYPSSVNPCIFVLPVTHHEL